MVKKAKKKSKTVSYPWDEWFTDALVRSCGATFTLVERRDYKCMTCSMTRAIRKAAARRQYAVKVTVDRGVRRGRTRCDKIHVTVKFGQ